MGKFGKAKCLPLVVQCSRSFAKRAPLASMVVVLLASLAAYSFIAGFGSAAPSFSVGFIRLDSAWLSLLFALLLLLVLFALVLLVKPFSFLNGEWFADCERLSLGKGVLFVLLGAVVPCAIGFLALASPLFAGLESAAGGLFGASGSPANPPMFGVSSDVSPASASSDAVSAALDSPSARVSALLGLYAVATCAFTALFEEMLFRGIVIPCVVAKTGQAAFAVRVSALLFAAAHLELSFLPAAPAPDALLHASSWVLAGQFVLKPVQAALFGFCMGSLYCSTRSLRLPIVVHFFFDLIYFAPSLLSAGAFPSTYMSGNLFDLVLLLVSVLFLGVAALLLREAKQGEGEADRPVVPQTSVCARQTRQAAEKRNGTD